MTTTAPPSLRRREVAVVFEGHSWSDLLEHAAMVVLLAIWAVPFTRATGGRGVHNELLFAAALLLILLAMRAWRVASGSVALAGVVASAAMLVCVFAPSGWYGSDVATGYAIAAGAYVGARRYVRDAERRMLVAACICLAALYQFEQAFLPWWGSRDPSTEMSGTFYWHNPYAAFLLPGAVLGLGLVALRRPPWSLVGWVSVPICTAGIVFSSSRATLAVLVVAWALMFAFGLRQKVSFVRGGAAIGLAVVVTAALPGPPLFPHYSAPWTAISERAATGQTLAQNGAYRTEFWREAADVALHHPIVGSGYHELANASALYTPSNWARSPQAHDGYLQAFSDGGLLLGLPFLAAVLVVLWWSLASLWAAVRRRGRSPDTLEIAVAVTILAALAHSAVDFDWSHPSILVQIGLLAACVAPVGTRVRHARVSAVALAALGAVLAVSIPALHEWQVNQPIVSYSNNRLLDEAAGPFGDFRPGESVLDQYVNAGRTVSALQVRQALARTSREAGVDMHLALLRDAAGARAGLDPGAVAQAEATLRQIHGSTAPYAPDLALVLANAGQAGAAQDVLSSDIARQIAGGAAAPDLTDELLQWANSFGLGSSYACEYDAARKLVDPSAWSAMPTPTAACLAGDQGHG